MLLRSIFVAVLAMVSIPAFSDDAKETDPESSSVSATKGTPDIDGEIDAKWKDAETVDVKKPVISLLVVDKDKMGTAKVRFLWDEDHVYALWEVTDSKLSAEASDDWEQDSVELFIDENQKRTSFYEDDDAQYRVNFEGRHSGQGAGHDLSNMKSAVRKTETGYVVEMAIKVQATKLESGKKLGVEMQLNDDPGTGGRGSVVKWNHVLDDSWQDTSNFGTLVLK